MCYRQNSAVRAAADAKRARRRAVVGLNVAMAVAPRHTHDPRFDLRSSLRLPSAPGGRLANGAVLPAGGNGSGSSEWAQDRRR